MMVLVTDNTSAQPVYSVTGYSQQSTPGFQNRLQDSITTLNSVVKQSPMVVSLVNSSTPSGLMKVDGATLRPKTMSSNIRTVINPSTNTPQQIVRASTLFNSPLVMTKPNTTTQPVMVARPTLSAANASIANISTNNIRVAGVQSRSFPQRPPVVSPVPIAPQRPGIRHATVSIFSKILMSFLKDTKSCEKNTI